jgi:hypothetical protein
MKLPHNTIKRNIKKMNEDELRKALYFEIQRSYFFESLSSTYDKQAFTDMASKGGIKKYEN